MPAPPKSFHVPERGPLSAAHKARVDGLTHLFCAMSMAIDSDPSLVISMALAGAFVTEVNAMVNASQAQYGESGRVEALYCADQIVENIRESINDLRLMTAPITSSSQN